MEVLGNHNWRQICLTIHSTRLSDARTRFKMISMRQLLVDSPFGVSFAPMQQTQIRFQTALVAAESRWKVLHGGTLMYNNQQHSYL